MHRRPAAFLPSVTQVEFTGGRSVDFVSSFSETELSIADRQCREWSAIVAPHKFGFDDEVESGLCGL